MAEKKLTRKEAKRKNLLQVLALIVIAAVIIAVVVIAQMWFSSRPDPQPEESAIEVTVGEDTREVLPYLIAEPGTEGEAGEVDTFDVGPDDTVEISVPPHVFDHDWSVVRIYDDPAINDQTLYGPNERDQVSVPGSVDPVNEGDERPRLMVVEVQSVLIGTDGEEETPYSVVWSVATEYANSLSEE